MGIDNNRVLDAMLSETGKPPKPEVPREVESLQKELAEIKRSLAEQHEQQMIQGEHSKIGTTIKALADQNPLLSALAEEQGSQVVKDIWQRAVDSYRKNQTPPNYAEIIKQAESDYTQNILSSISRLVVVPKIKDEIVRYLSPQQTQAANKNLPKSATGKTQTLTNDLNQEPKTVKRPLTDEEADAEFIRIMREKGWKKEE